MLNQAKTFFKIEGEVKNFSDSGGGGILIRYPAIQGI